MPLAPDLRRQPAGYRHRSQTTKGWQAAPMHRQVGAETACDGIGFGSWWLLHRGPCRPFEQQGEQSDCKRRDSDPAKEPESAGRGVFGKRRGEATLADDRGQCGARESEAERDFAPAPPAHQPPNCNGRDDGEPRDLEGPNRMSAQRLCCTKEGQCQNQSNGNHDRKQRCAPSKLRRCGDSRDLRTGANCRPGIGLNFGRSIHKAPTFRAQRAWCASREPHRPRLPHLGLDAVLGFELIHELVGRKLGGEDVNLALHGGEVAGA